MNHNSSIYREKYLKYKKKYLELKQIEEQLHAGSSINLKEPLKILGDQATKVASASAVAKEGLRKQIQVSTTVPAPAKTDQKAGYTMIKIF